MSKFKVGDKVKFPQKKSLGAFSYKEFLEEIIEQNEVSPSYFVIQSPDVDGCHIMYPDYCIAKWLDASYFHEDDLELYVSPSEYEAKVVAMYPVSEKVIVVNPTNATSTDPNLSLRYNSGKPSVGLIHNGSLLPLTRVLEFGAAKYTPNNWQKGFDKIKLLESMKRHVDELMDAANGSKSEIDEESQEHIIGHIMANAMFYSYHFVIDEKNK